MKVSDFLDSRAVVDLRATNKKEVLEELCNALISLHPSLDRTRMVGILLDRERLGSTGVGEGVAIPHGKLSELTHLIACFGRSSQGLEFQAVDRKPVHLFFLLFAPENSAGTHLKALAKISRLLKRPNLREALMAALSVKEVFSILTQEDAEEAAGSAGSSSGPSS
ncbi:MAG: PTS sugar transporter subunit IIA [bacterium]